MNSPTLPLLVVYGFLNYNRLTGQGTLLFSREHVAVNGSLQGLQK